jgi:predicted transcriptional regulator
MTKAVTVEIADEMALTLAQVANDLGETQEQFVARAVAARLDAFHANSFFARRKKDFDRQGAIDWLLNREGGEPPQPGDELPDGYKRIG